VARSLKLMHVLDRRGLEFVADRLYSSYCADMNVKSINQQTITKLITGLLCLDGV